MYTGGKAGQQETVIIESKAYSWKGSGSILLVLSYIPKRDVDDFTRRWWGGGG